MRYSVFENQLKKYAINKTADDLAQFVNQLKSNKGAFSLTILTNKHREKESWLSSCGVACDIDFEPNGVHVPLTVLAKEALPTLTAGIDCNIWYTTPRGFRAIRIFDKENTDRDLQIDAQFLFAAHVGQAIKRASDFTVDLGCASDLVKLYFAPNAMVNEYKEKRDKETNKKTYETISTENRQSEIIVKSTILKPIEIASWDSFDRTCPYCGHNGCFSVHPATPRKWFCFSSNHTKGGRPCDGGWFGDTRDYAYFVCGQDDPLDNPEFSKSKKQKKEKSDDVKTDFYPHTTAGLVDILTKEQAIIFGGEYAFDEVSCSYCVDKKEVPGEIFTSVQAKINQNFFLPPNKQGECKPLQFNSRDVKEALCFVGKQKKFNPIRDYLLSLSWDGVARLDDVASDILCCNKTDYNSLVVKKFILSMVARGISPGEKVDTCLILAGPQGPGKTKFLGELAHPWYGTSGIDPTSKDGRLQLRGKWLIEWGELNALNSAREAEKIKHFLSEREDDYRAPYEAKNTRYPRACVFVGTTNETEFLTDYTGNRRFWVVECHNKIETELLKTNRDQIFAEAVQLLKDDATWWLDDDEEKKNEADNYVVSDTWSEVITEYLKNIQGDQTTLDILSHAICLTKDKQDKGSQMRVGKLMRKLGYQKKQKGDGKNYWIKSNGHIKGEKNELQSDGNDLQGMPLSQPN